MGKLVKILFGIDKSIDKNDISRSEAEKMIKKGFYFCLRKLPTTKTIDLEIMSSSKFDSKF